MKDQTKNKHSSQTGGQWATCAGRADSEQLHTHTHSLFRSLCGDFPLSIITAHNHNPCFPAHINKAIRYNFMYLGNGFFTQWQVRSNIKLTHLYLIVSIQTNRLKLPSAKPLSLVFSLIRRKKCWRQS